MVVSESAFLVPFIKKSEPKKILDCQTMLKTAGCLMVRSMRSRSPSPIEALKEISAICALRKVGQSLLFQISDIYSVICVCFPPFCNLFSFFLFYIGMPYICYLLVDRLLVLVNLIPKFSFKLVNLLEE